jgi:hypothetical protein
MAQRFRQRPHLLLGLVVLIILTGISGLLVGLYGGGSFWPGLVSGFIATLVAFILALYLEREREQRQLSRSADELVMERATEVRRRLAPVRRELEVNKESVDFLATTYATADKDRRLPTFLHPQLLEGAWAANAPRLSEIVADYGLIGDLAFSYGRIEELRWRLRYRSEHPEWSQLMDGMTVGLVTELRDEVADLLERVSGQITSPAVQPLGLSVTIRGSRRAG